LPWVLDYFSLDAELFHPLHLHMTWQVFALGMPMAVSLCLLETDVMQAFTDAGSTLKAFWFGAIGTVMGAVVAFGAVGHFLGPNGWKVI